MPSIRQATDADAIRRPQVDQRAPDGQGDLTELAQGAFRLRDVLAELERGAETSDAIATALELEGAQAAPALAALEALGYVSRSLVGVYSRTLLSAPAI